MSWHQFENDFPVMAKALKNAQRTKRMTHAFMVYADQPQVREYAPVALGQLRVCLNPAPDATPCEKCAHCVGLAHHTYSEMFTLSPVSKSRQIRIGKDRYEPNSMRWFESQFYFTADSDESTKIGVIQEAECLNEQAQNGFLKTLEEPPRQTFFVLVTSAPYQLLPTIRSRCQMISLLSNQCNYTQSFVEPLMNALEKLSLVESNDFCTAENCASEVITLAQGLKSEAESVENEIWAPMFDEIKQMEWSATERKSIEERRDAAIQARYLGLRSSFLSLIHDWFAIAWQQSMGINSTEVNPEIHQRIPAELQNKEKRNRMQLDCAEKLLSNLKYNINEELAFRVFVHDTASTPNHLKG